MKDAQTLARQQQRIEELCAGAIRALAGEADLHFRGQRLYRKGVCLPSLAPHLHPRLEHEDFRAFRGAADGLALRLSLSDAALHAALAPQGANERLLFDLLEQFRVESLRPTELIGVAHNLRHGFEQWSLAFHHSGLTQSARGALIYTVAQVCRARVCSERVLEETEDLMEAPRAALMPLIGQDVAGLRLQRAHQAAYAVHALAIASRVADILRAHAVTDAALPSDKNEIDPRGGFRLFIDSEGGDDDLALPVAISGRSARLDAAPDAYRVYTTSYDREINAATLLRSEQLAELRQRLDQRIAAQSVNVGRLARELTALLARPRTEGWDSGLEDGYVDGRRLPQLISSPLERRLFRREREQPRADCALSFLIDCSGSMKVHAEDIAVLVDVFARALESVDVTAEILGYTTGAWNGGRARRDWLRAGSPRHPGRLNERQHLVFKDADTSWRHARPALAALLKPELFREGIDGEAVAWACGRLMAGTASRRLLIVISDGCPMDTATELANDAHCLDHHLREVVMRWERQGGVEIYGLGVGLDLSSYYSRSQAMDHAALHGNAAWREVLAMLACSGRR